MRRCQRRLAEFGMRIAAQWQVREPIQHHAGAVDCVDPRPRRAAVRGPAANDDVDIDAALVAQRDAVVGAQPDDAEFRRVSQFLEDRGRGIVSSGLAGAAERENQPAAERAVAVGENGGLDRRRECTFLFRDAASAHRAAFRKLKDLAGIGIFHRRRGMGHRVSHQQQRPVAILRTELDDQVAHGITATGQALPGQQRRDAVADKGLHRRLGLHRCGLRAGKPHQLLRQGGEFVFAERHGHRDSGSLSTGAG